MDLTKLESWGITSATSYSDAYDILWEKLNLDSLTNSDKNELGITTPDEIINLILTNPSFGIDSPPLGEDIAKIIPSGFDVNISSAARD